MIASDTDKTSGYCHRDYAKSLAEFGTPHELVASGGWVLERTIPGRQERDAMGCYPLFACREWQNLPQDLVELGRRLVTLALVTDPFADIGAECLQRYFDVVKPFKNHYVADLCRPIEQFVNKHHRYYARRSLRELEVEVCADPVKYLAEWTSLYNNLIERHGIKGMRAFSAECFRQQLTTPGMFLVVGKLQGAVAGAHLVALHDNVAYSHLAAFSPAGYERFAAYGVYWITLEYLAANGVRYFDLGASAGIDANSDDGLDRFKRGWSTTTRMVYLCGSIFNRGCYSAICQDRQVGDTAYFPAYRAGEFG